MKEKRALRRERNRKYRGFRKHLKVRVWGVSLADQRWERMVARSWSGEVS
jgi:hypothetical protein